MQSQILPAIHKINKSKNLADVKAITKKKINKTSGTSFDEGYVAVNESQLLDKKIMTNVKTSQQLDSFRLSTTEITFEDNLPLQVEEIVLDDIEQCQQHTHFIRNLSEHIINNALGNLEKSSDATKITMCHTNEMSAIVQQLTSDDTLVPIPNDIHTSITENHRTSLSVFSTDDSFQKLELKTYELNRSVNHELALLNKKMDSFSEHLNKLVNSTLTSHQEKSL